MKAKKHWILVAIVTILLTGLWSVAATEDVIELQKKKDEIMTLQKQLDRWILKDLAGVTPQVTILSFDVPCNLTKNELQTQVELRLRQSGIKVFSEMTEKEPNSLNILSVVVSLKDIDISSSRFYSVDSSTKLKEPVFLFRDPQKFTAATTWEALPSSSGVLREVPTKADILEAVNSSVDQFINDYLAANPKK
jgi:hypothetical protein